MKRIGILGGLSAESTAIFYSTLTRMYVERAGEINYPEIVIFSVRFGDFAEWSRTGDWEAYTNGLAEGIRALERAGADFAVIASNTPHIVYDELVKRVSLPVIHIAEALAAEAQEKGFKKLALLGTMATMNADFYQRVLARYGIECFVPGDKQKGIIQAVLDAELYKGIINEASRTQYIEIISEMKEAGADAVILGCTEIPMLISDANSPLPTLDSSLLLARAALDRSLA